MRILLECVGVAGACWLGWAALFGAVRLFYLIWPPVKRRVLENVRFWL